MPDKKDSTRGLSQDRHKVAGAEDHEIEYEKEKKGATKKEVKDTVRKVSNEYKRVE